MLFSIFWDSCRFLRFKNEFISFIQGEEKWRVLWFHNISGQSGVSEFFLVVQEGEAVESDVGFVDTVATEGIAHPFAGHDGRHQWDDVPHAARQFEHDHHQGNYNSKSLYIDWWIMKYEADFEWHLWTSYLSFALFHQVRLQPRPWHTAPALCTPHLRRRTRRGISSCADYY